MALIKREYTDKETLITAKNLNDIQDAIIALEDGLFVIDAEASGSVIHMEDASTRGIRNMKIYGKTTQNGTPTPDAPVDLVSAGDGGSVKVIVSGKNLLSEPFVIGVHRQNGYANNNTAVISTKGIYLRAGTYVVSCPYVSGLYMYVNGMTDATHTSDYQANYLNVRTIKISEDGLYNLQFNKPTGETFTVAELQIVNASAQLEFGTTETPYEHYKGQTLTIITPNGLPGIPVTSDGNYTDENGQEWVCDEIDFERGTFIKRVNTETITGTHTFQETADEPGRFLCTPLSYLYKEGANEALANFAPWGRWGIADGHFTISRKNLLFSPATAMTAAEVTALFAEMIASENPPVIIAQLAEPIETPLSEEELTAYKALHTYRDNTTISNDGNAHMELEYIVDAKKYIDSIAGASGSSVTISSVVLRAANWSGSSSPYSQNITSQLKGVTDKSMVTLQPSVQQLSTFHDKDLAFVTENDDGIVTVYAIGDKPTSDYTIQVSITEVNA